MFWYGSIPSPNSIIPRRRQRIAVQDSSPPSRTYSRTTQSFGPTVIFREWLYSTGRVLRSVSTISLRLLSAIPRSENKIQEVSPCDKRENKRTQLVGCMLTIRKKLKKKALRSNLHIIISSSIWGIYTQITVSHPASHFPAQAHQE